jgi:two-component system chemotaxis sensor kinase CheA
MSLDAALQTFYVEAQEHLESMENILLTMDDGKCDHEMLNDIFRSAHTIKGSAGIFGLDHIVDFTHVIENVLDRARENKITVDRTLVDILFKCRDHMQSLVKLSLEDFQSDYDCQEIGKALLKDITPWSDEESKHIETDAPIASDELSQQENTDKLSNKGYWHISLRLADDCLKNGMDPLSFIRFLSTIGEIRHIETIDITFPEFKTFDPENLYFSYEISLKSDADAETIENTFMFVEEDSQITILPPCANAEQVNQLINSLPEDDDYLKAIFIKCGTYIETDIEQTTVAENTEVVENLTSKFQEAKESSKEQHKEQTASTNKQIRVDSDRVDHLINLIGELVINQQRIDLLANKTKNPQLIEAVGDFEGFTEQIRDAALSLRMVPIGGTFQRFKRLVRDTAQQLGKNVELVIKGADTELDRLMVEKLTDPLTHIVRNAMDHGLESIEQRLAAGKTEQGKLKLAAYHDAGHIIIEISDDGNGINKEMVREKAISKGIIHEESILTDNELFHLIFHPGFSTAAAVTNLSGRGVGMDVVKRNVEALQGNIEISSETGAGSTFKIRLPLTLAIIDGFHVESHGTHFIIPQATIIECIDLDSHIDIDGRHCINLRGDMIPYLNMEEVFRLSPPTDLTHTDTKLAEHKKTELVIVQFGGELAGIAVDKLNGEIQTVVKPLGPIFKPLKGIGGSSLLGSGEIAFILDIPQLIELAIGSDVDKNRTNFNRATSNCHKKS